MIIERDLVCTLDSGKIRRGSLVKCDRCNTERIAFYLKHEYSLCEKCNRKNDTGLQCEICFSENKIRISKKYQKKLCDYHYRMFYHRGSFEPKFKKSEVYKDETTAYIKVFKKNSEYISIIDIEDYEKVKKINWYLISSGYLATSNLPKIGKTVLLHYYLIEYDKEKFECDHINRNKLDNRKENLRIVTRRQNSLNVGQLKNNTSGYKGVTWNKKYKKWRAYIESEGIKYHLGYFENIEDAINIRKKAEQKFHKI